MDMSKHSLTKPEGVPSIAIIGSGPAGCYCAQFARKQWPKAEIIVFEALPAPFGLIRYGVAPDHQGTKAVIRQFERLFEREGVQLVGNVCIGRDLEFGDVARAFDVVIDATGLPHDRRLDIPVGEGCAVLGAGEMIQRLNGHPHHLASPAVALGARIAIIGNGNVAMDAVRLLCSGDADFEASDVDDEALLRLRAARTTQIEVLGRSFAPDAKFDLAMLREVAARSAVRVTARGLRPGDDDGRTRFLTELDAADASGGAAEDGRHIDVTFRFGVQPTEIRRTDRGTEVHIIDRASRAAETICVDSVVTAIGFCRGDLRPGPPDDADWQGENVFRAGWAAGHGGAIPVHRREAKALMREISDAVATGSIRTARGGRAEIQARTADRAVSFEDWRRLDAHELATAPHGRCRRKVTDVAEMVAIARQTSARAEALSGACPGTLRAQITADR